MGISSKYLYPIGEGAGYAGGITTAALDGLKCAMKIVDDYKKIILKFKTYSSIIKMERVITCQKLLRRH